MSVDAANNPEDQSGSENSTKYIILNKSTIHNPASLADISKKLLCVEYPGIVENVDKMIETLGGMHNIERAVGNYNRRLELKFHPDNIFCKPCWGDKDYNSGLLVKITARKAKSSEPSSSKSVEPDPTVFSYNTVGVIPMTFKFSRMCDFQYLPLSPKEDCEIENANTSCRNIYENIIPSKLPDLKWFESEESKSMPFFFPPPVFSKFNSSKDNKLFYERYKYYEKVLPEVAERLKKEAFSKKQEPKNIIGTRSRIFRKANSIFVNFHSKNVHIPEAPNEAALYAIKKRGLLYENGPMDTIKKLFQERPIWSKSALLHKSGVRNDRLKVILPGVAFYCTTGPWRIMWCKFGYNPMVDPNSRIYQAFDFRIRASGGLKVKVQAKRSYSSNIMQYKAGRITNTKFSLNDCSAENIITKSPVDETFYILKPGILPAARQMFYQYCDLELPEIQDMLSRLPKMTNDVVYHSKNGWLPNGFQDQCREVANKYVTDYVKSLLMKEKENISSTSISDQKKSVQSPKPDVTILGATIVIDDDDDDEDDREKSIERPDEGTDSEVTEGEDDLMDFDGAEDGGDELDDDIDLEAVDEINKIIGNLEEPELQTQNEDNDSDEESDPELINLYRKLILSNTEGNV